jgi:hypothetical protein
MQLNIKKLDERIQKLQEIKRIAADPELVAMLLEFIASDDEHTEPAKPAKVHAGVSTHHDDMEIVNQVMKGMEAQGSGAWSAKRA